jgi:UDP-N-acetyl-2-amino-2-deoxyglucuronate dehydrogenase
MKNFALVGAAGYIAPRHLKAIKETGNNLVAALDKHDNVGVLDSYFPNADFFTEFERFERHVDKLKRKGTPVDYVSICSPNYLHDSHIRFALRNGAHAICEKPLVLNPWNVDALQDMEAESDRKISTILQLRLHPAIIGLKNQIASEPTSKKHNINLRYITSRGNWYHHSWKGDVTKSGGIATNIGIHFFDMLIWVFGAVKNSTVEKMTNESASGTIELERANVTWFLSINYNDIPEEVKKKGARTFRTLSMNNQAIEFSEGFTELHTESYKAILAGRGFGLADARPSIELAHSIRNTGA